MSERRLDFLCLGPQRTASSWLHLHLAKHPQLAFPVHVKETMFFDDRFDKGMDWYWGHFDENVERKLCGEVAPTYFDSDHALDRVRVFEGIKLVFLIRNPIERTYSLYRHHRSKGRVNDDYYEAVKKMPRIETSGHYAAWCEKWEQAFGSDNCLYLMQEDIEDSPQSVFDTLCQFLDVDCFPLPEEADQRYGQAIQPRWPLVTKVLAAVSTKLRSTGVHKPLELMKSLGLKSLLMGKSVGHESIPEDVHERLVELYRDDIAWIESKIGRPVGHWLSQSGD